MRPSTEYSFPKHQHCLLLVRGTVRYEQDEHFVLQHVVYVPRYVSLHCSFEARSHGSEKRRFTLSYHSVRLPIHIIAAPI